MQKQRKWGICLIMLGLAGVLAAGIPLRAQGESASQPPLYTYLSTWAVPRAQWGAMAKLDEQEKPLLDKLLSDGTITGYGEYIDLIHSEGHPTHGDFFFATSEGHVVKALAAFHAQPGMTSPVLAASKHWDHFLVSRIHSQRSGTFDGAYMTASEWQLKPGQMHAFEAIVKARVVPLLKKEMADGNVIYYSMDTQDYHTDPPGMVDVIIAVPNAAALDKVNAAFHANFGKDTEIGPAIAALTKMKNRRDFLIRFTHLSLK